MREETTLYRFFDANDRLLYVGISNLASRRWAQHEADKPWWSEVARTSVEHFATRKAALEAEKRAIQTEHPKHNVVHNRSNVRKPEMPKSASRPYRITSVADEPLSPTSLVGSFFLAGPTEQNPDLPGWQGCVIAEPRPGLYLVELFSWFMGDSTNQQLVAIEDMAGWEFFDTSEWMVNAYEHGTQTRWDRIRATCQQPA